MALDVNIIDRNDATALIPVETSNEIIKEVPLASKLLPLMRRLPNMVSKQRNMPIAKTLANAYFLNGGDTGQKKTTKADWGTLELVAEELAVIVPIPEAVIDDASYDIWGEIKPQIVEALGLAIDNAILFGVDKPNSWASAIVPTAITKGNVVELGSITETGTGGAPINNIGIDIGGKDGVMAKVESNGYRVNGFLADSTLEASFRGVQAVNGVIAYQPALTTNVPGTLFGRAISYDNSGNFDLETALLVAGDFSKAVYAIRQDITYKVLDQAIIQNTDGSIAYNLAQQDMIALRVVMRIGVQVAVPPTRRKGTSGYPFAVLAPAS